MNNLDPEDVAHWLKQQAIILDVREPEEYMAEHIRGTLPFPLSNFDPHTLPEPGGRRIVFHCGSGVRSGKAVAQCEDAGLAFDCHMSGGIQDWKAAGLPTIAVDPATGEMNERHGR